MSTLFPIEPAYPEGFSYAPDFISGDEEMRLCEAISTIELHNFNFQGYTANRKVASFGYDYSFENGKLDRGKDMAVAFDSLIEKVSDHVGVPQADFEELLVTEYPPGAVY